MDQALNAGFFVFHTAWVLFICAGWIAGRTRRAHLAAVGLTAASWFGLGIRYGWGYCPCTDWHWQIRARLGYDDPPSYTQLLVAELTGLELTTFGSNALAVAILGSAAAISLTLNVRDWRARPPTHAAAPRQPPRGPR